MAGLFSLVYTNLKVLVTLVAQVGHLQRDREWVTTPRAGPETSKQDGEEKLTAVLKETQVASPEPECRAEDRPA